MYNLVFYFKENGQYTCDLKIIKKMLENISKKWMIEHHIIEASKLSSYDAQKIKRDIRSTLPQVRGKIVSSKNYLLPLSGTKNLNLNNTPILLIYENGASIDVYPHLLGTTYITIENILQRIIDYGPKEYLQVRGLLENPAQKILVDFPSILEPEMKCIGSNVDSEAGVIDILLRDKNGREVVVEIETNAKDSAVAQVCRLAIGYGIKFKIPLDRIRKVIVCYNYDKNLIKTCKGAGVELFQITTKRLI
jgi:hypothetical protein